MKSLLEKTEKAIREREENEAVVLEIQSWDVEVGQRR